MQTSHATLPELRKRLREVGNPADAVILQRFFKTGPGQYGEGDRFLGIRVPATRALLRHSDGLSIDDILVLLHSKFHEERLLALLIFVRRFERGDEVQRQHIFSLYLRQTEFINNWDLVDLSAPNIVGQWLLTRDRAVLYDLVRSKSLWERRIAVLASFTFIRHGQFADTLRLCQELLTNDHDLMHKACGWMLREVGKRNESVLEQFLGGYAARMPRTMLRYAIERLPEARRRFWLATRRTS